jgi:hypothetical protein
MKGSMMDYPLTLQAILVTVFCHCHSANRLRSSTKP